MQAGNDKFDIRRARQQLDEKARAHIKFEHLSNKRKHVNEETGAPDPNSQLVGATNSQFSDSLQDTSPVAVPDVAQTTPAPREPADSDFAKGFSNPEQRGLPIEPYLAKEHESGRKRRRREKGTLSRFNNGDSGPEGQSPLHCKALVFANKAKSYFKNPSSPASRHKHLPMVNNHRNQ